MVTVCCLVGSSSGVLMGVVAGNFVVKCVSRYWRLTLKNEVGLVGLKGSMGQGAGEKNRMLHQDLLSPLSMGTVREATTHSLLQSRR